jgi:hypothetical protein
VALLAGVGVACAGRDRAATGAITGMVLVAFEADDRFASFAFEAY